MFVRKKKNRSGTISVVVVDKSRGKFREVKKLKFLVHPTNRVIKFA